MTNKQRKNRSDNTSPIAEEQNLLSQSSGGAIYEIHVKGHLDSSWSDWLEDLEVKLIENGEMILTGPIIDQAALMGVLYKINRLNLTLLSVFRTEMINVRRQNE